MISIVVAYDENRVIGYQNQLPWHLPNDLRHFKELTIGKTIVMGRSTYESIGKALPDRRNIVLTRSTSFQASGVEVVQQMENIFTLGDIMIIGGASIYKQFLPYTDQLYITEIHHSFQGDTYFPEWNEEDYQLISKETGIEDEKNIYPHTFYHFSKKDQT
ncbi:dihydrofolate reductase [Shimazuella sp. AN120528]|uniref:dihydrofolate reductase n=1 Tax=Shimazuella soli TaxID=1892854 RepID=UPI001F1168BB|nr:dihydrofolate reductase [Shimazuella soli]MCH5585689.1 dihydrofolate reductase [Shimazuella soli]